jgi:hypothetical protein
VGGAATADFLRAGLTVDFKAEFDDQGALKDKISQLTVVTPSTDLPMGVFPDSEGAMPSRDASADVRGTKGTKAGKHGVAAKGAAKTASGKAPPAGPCRVVAKLVNIKGKLSFQLHGIAPIELALADSCTIKVEFADYSSAVEGDKISVKGFAAPSAKIGLGRVIPNTAASGMAQATVVKITLAEPLTGVKKKTPAARSSSKHPKKAKDNEGAPPAE